MSNINNVIPRIFSESANKFNEFASEIFSYQSTNNKIFKQWLQITHPNSDEYDPENVTFLPVQFFKSHIVTTTNSHQLHFESSSTTGLIPSKHFVFNAAIYQQSFIQSFEHFYGNSKNYSFLCLLPSYLERNNSSLVYMCNYFVENSNYKSGFFLHNFNDLYIQLLHNIEKQIPTILLGVTYALLQFSKAFNIPKNNCILVMETGGMKGRDKEITRAELHNILTKNFNTNCIHSEYGMTELLSQAYSKNNGLYFLPPWIKIVITDPNDFKKQMPAGKSGRINVIDLANVYSCSFIATDDIGILHPDGSFEILGRFDFSDQRGCSLMFTSN